MLRALLWPEVGAWLASYEYFEQIDSTNTYLLEHLKQRSGDGYVALTSRQTAGRGRLGRPWVAFSGNNCALSLVFDMKNCKLDGFSLAIGLALHKVLSRLGVEQLTMKWPNDMMVGDRKIAGILVETLKNASSTYAVVGIGLNVALSEEELSAIDRPVTSLKALNIELNPLVFVVNLLNELVTTYFSFLKYEGSLSPWLSTLKAIDYLEGRHVRVVQPQQIIEGTACGIDLSGALKIQTSDQQIHTIVCGELKVLCE